MGEMLERATAAVMQAMGDGPGTRDYLRCTALVRAVLQAIREPSIEVILAGTNTLDDGGGQLHRRKWYAQIDAILAETPSEP